MTTYCEAAQENPHHKTYHDRHYGFPIRSDADLFERLILEINQAGLSWLTILKKQENFRTAYRGFEIDRVAAFTEKDRTRLLAQLEERYDLAETIEQFGQAGTTLRLYTLKPELARP